MDENKMKMSINRLLSMNDNYNNKFYCNRTTVSNGIFYGIQDCFRNFGPSA